MTAHAPTRMWRLALQMAVLALIAVLVCMFALSYQVSAQTQSGSGVPGVRDQAAPTPTTAAVEATGVVPSVTVIVPSQAQIQPATAVAEGETQPLTQSEGGALKRWMYVAAALVAFLGVVLLIIAVRGGSRRPQGP